MALQGRKYARHLQFERKIEIYINWCRSKLGWTLDRNWKKVIFSDETQVVVDQKK
jgi:hypothetical protein